MILKDTANYKSVYQKSEFFSLGALLALSGGFLDAYTFISRGGVFANAQTGNMVLLGVNLAFGNFKAVLYYFVPVVAFALGVFLSEFIKHKYKQLASLHWRQIIIIVETAILFIISFVPSGDYNVFANVAISFVSAMQVQTFRKVHGLPYATTMCIGNLRNASQNLFSYFKNKDKVCLNKSIKYYSIIVFFILGAFLGCFLSNIFYEKAVLLVCILLIVVFFVMQ